LAAQTGTDEGESDTDRRAIKGPTWKDTLFAFLGFLRFLLLLNRIFSFVCVSLNSITILLRQSAMLDIATVLI